MSKDASKERSTLPCYLTSRRKREEEIRNSRSKTSSVVNTFYSILGERRMHDFGFHERWVDTREFSDVDFGDFSVAVTLFSDEIVFRIRNRNTGNTLHLIKKHFLRIIIQESKIISNHNLN